MSKKNFCLRLMLVFLASPKIYCEANKIYNLNAVLFHINIIFIHYCCKIKPDQKSQTKQ